MQAASNKTMEIDMLIKRYRSMLLASVVAFLGLVTLVTFASSLQAAETDSRSKFVQSTVVDVEQTSPMTPTMPGMTGTDHAAHHPESMQAETSVITTTEAVSTSMPMSGGMPADMGAMMDSMGSDMGDMMGDMGGMMGDMGSMMSSMHAMHADTASILERVLEQNTEALPVDSLVDLSRVLGRMEAMDAMMQGMSGTMHGGDTSSTQGMPGMEGTDANLPFDARFIDSMIEHHRGAIAMAETVLEQGEHEELLAMANAIISAQTSEIEEMEAWRAEWYPELEATSGLGMSMGEMAIPAHSDQPFDYRFLGAMISHHAGAIEMAKMAQAEGEHEEILQLAQAIIDAQEGEIAQMQEWLAEWYPDLPAPVTAADSMMGHTAAGCTGAAQMMAEMQTILAELTANDGQGVSPNIAAGLGRMMGMVESMAAMGNCPMAPEAGESDAGGD
jgi:uncharacterized protein (DUF305 family)